MARPRSQRIGTEPAAIAAGMPLFVRAPLSARAPASSRTGRFAPPQLPARWRFARAARGIDPAPKEMIP